MIEVVVVDTSAEARGRLAERISQFQREASTAHAVCPLINIKPLSVHELKFHPSPDVVIIGKESLRQDLAEIALVKKHFLKARIIADLGSDLDNFIIAEQMARLGVDDVIHEGTSATDFFRKLILLQRASTEDAPGKLILVDSGKGGMGVTSIAAALAESSAELGKKTIVVDLDSETQDLSRFLQARPFWNENLDAILDQERPVLAQTVEQCVYKVWEDEEKLFFVPPPSRSLSTSEPRDILVRSFLSFLESLDKTAEVVIVDVAGIRGSLYQALLKVADKIVFVLQNDPAALYASVQSLKTILSVTMSHKDLLLLENAHAGEGLPSGFIAVELARQLNLREHLLDIKTIHRCKHGARWPASGGTLYSQGKKNIQQSFQEVLRVLGIESGEKKPERMLQKLVSTVRKIKLPVRNEGEIKLLVPPVTEMKEPQLTLPEPAPLVSKATII